MVYREKQYNDTLCHFNPNHDPRNGQFAESPGHTQTNAQLSDRTKNSTTDDTQSKQKSTKNKDVNMNHDRVKKLLKIGGIALGSALVVLGARYLIDDAVQSYAKRHMDKILKSDTILSTLSFDRDRLTNADMFYATHHQKDKTFYAAMFNRPISELLDKNGKVIGTGTFLKKRIDSTVTSGIKIASEDSGAKIFESLCKNDPDFFSYVLNRGGMSSKFVDSKYKFKGYREARSALEKARTASDMNSIDFKTIYRMFNYVIPNTDATTVIQRKKFFSELLSAGYGGILDTNDGLYGGFKARSPVIVFDMTKIAPASIYQTTMTDKKISVAKTIANRALGLNL